MSVCQVLVDMPLYIGKELSVLFLFSFK